MATLSTSNPQLPSIESISAAIVAAQVGSFSAAALDLCITHAAISRRIAALENWAGVKIFKRHARGIVVTEDGQRILTRLENVISQIETLSVKRKTKGQIPTVKLAVTPSFARFFLLPRLALLEGRPKDIHIDIVASLTHADLIGGEVDLAIRYGRGAWKKTHAIRLLDDELYVVASQKLDFNSYNRANLLQLPLLHAGDTTNWRTWCLDQKIAYKAKVTDRIFCDYALALEAAANGLGIALWNQKMHDLDKYGDDLVPLNFAKVKGLLSYYLLSRVNIDNSPIETLRQRILNNL
jgi:LysR family glycine cleavage system transcriptional activator